MHDGNYNNTILLTNPYTTKFGIIENITGPSLSKLSKVNKTTYANLKSSWSYPQSREFSFFIENLSSSTVFTYETVTPGKEIDVFVKQSKITVLDKYGNRKTLTLRIKGW